MNYFNKLISNGYLTDSIGVGGRITDELKDFRIEKWQEQEGDVPAIYNLFLDDLLVEVSLINNIIFAFQIRLDKISSCSFFLIYNEKQFLISLNSNFIDFIKFLNENHVSWEFNIDESNDHRIVIKVNDKIDFYFLFEIDDWGLFRVSSCDLKLYESFL
jgi:hypothetical protein